MSESPAFSLFWKIDEAKGAEIPYYIFSPGPERSHGRVYAADWLRHTGLFLTNTLPLLPPHGCRLDAPGPSGDPATRGIWTDWGLLYPRRQYHCPFSLPAASGCLFH